MSDKKKLMLTYIIVFVICTITKLVSQSVLYNSSVLIHCIISFVVLCIVILVVQFGRMSLNIRAMIGIILIYAFDIALSILDKRFLHTPLVGMVLLMVSGALLEKTIVLAVFVACNILSAAFCIFFPELAFGTLTLYQVMHMMMLGNATGILMYVMTRWASELIAKSNEEAAEADRANMVKTQFLASVSHEIRTPMNAIFGMNELILAASESTNIAELKQKAAYIKTAGVDLLALINDILDISKLEQGKMELVETPYNSADLFSSLEDELRRMVGTRPLSVHVGIETPIVRDLMGDDVRIRQIVVQLIGNAVKFTTEGSVELIAQQRSTPDGVCLVIAVKDTGCGMTEENIQRILQSRDTSYFKDNKDSQGIGIGLSITVKLLDMMKGKLNITSEPGKGSIFEVVIPQQISKEPVKSADVANQMDKPTLSGARILVVDDNVTNIQVCRGIFKRYAIDIDTALSGRDAVMKSEKTPYDLIFMDHMMPGMNGLQAMQAIHALGDPHNAQVPVVVLTADNGKEVEQSLLKSGFDAFLSKPINTIELTRILRTYLGNFINPDKRNSHAPQYALGLILPGINVQKGIQNTGGTLDVYLEVLNLFKKSGTQQASKFETAFRDEDLEMIAIGAHALNSAAANIGAERLAEMCSQLEQQSKDKDIKGVKNSSGPLLSELQKLLETISAALKTPTPAPIVPKKGSLGVDEAVEQLERLSIAAEAYDLKTASDILTTLMEYSFSAEITDMLCEIMAGINAFAYASTVEKAKRIVQLLQDDQTTKGVDEA